VNCKRSPPSELREAQTLGCFGASRALNQEKKALNGARILLLGSLTRGILTICGSPWVEDLRVVAQGGAEVRYNDPYIASIGKARTYDFQITRG
jgi:UDP-N-acetyl-D-glucosamine dehydrogenase